MLFTVDPQSIVNLLAERTHGGILGFHYVHEKPALIRVSRPIQAWYVTGTVGDPDSKDKVIDRSGDVDSAHTQVVLDQADGPLPDSGTGSLIPPRNSSQIVNALIVADARKVGGEEIGQIADYIALLALSQARTLDDCSPLPSILDLMSSACPSRAKPQTLTDSDIAFLKALYASDITTSAGGARNQIAIGMANSLDAGQR